MKKYTHIGDAGTEHAFLTSAGGCDLATLRPVTVDAPGLNQEHCMTPEEWQGMVDLVNAAPEMLAALQAIAARVAEDRETVESLGYCYTDSAEEDCADIARAAIAKATA